MGFPKKLTEEQRLLVCRLVAEGRTPTEAVAYIKEEWDISFTVQGVKTILETKRFQIQLKVYRESYLKRIKDVPLANKRLRLDDLQYIRDKLMRQLKNNDCATKCQRDEFRAQVRTLNDVIASSREEMEKKPNLIPGLGLVGDFSDKSDEQLISERDDILKAAESALNRGTSGVNSNTEGTFGQDQAESA